MAISRITISEKDRNRLFARQEGHFLDMKSKLIQPAKLTRSLSGFANADGGELFIGVEELKGTGALPLFPWRWDGFADEEAANGLIQAFEEVFLLGQDIQYEFLECPADPGLVLHVNVMKSRGIRRATDRVAYIRRGAQNLPVTAPEALVNLERAKGISSYEDETLNASSAEITNSMTVVQFMLEVVPQAEAEPWLRKQQLVILDKPTVAGCVLFADLPQAFIPKAAVKVYRYMTEGEGTRDTLAFDPLTIEGPLYEQVRGAVSKTVELAEDIKIMTPDGLEAIKYPHESLHEIITNAVLHRDYAAKDDVHVRIYDNRIEVESPGRLPAHITPQNILSERFARNPKIVRIINKFPDPPNKDVGEGLNTAFEAMKKLRLRDPEITERPHSVLVFIRHEKLASPEQLILEHIREHETINNTLAREVTGIESEVKVLRIFKSMVKAGEIEQVPGTFKSSTAYRIPDAKRGP